MLSGGVITPPCGCSCWPHWWSRWNSWHPALRWSNPGCCKGKSSVFSLFVFVFVSLCLSQCLSNQWIVHRFHWLRMVTTHLQQWLPILSTRVIYLVDVTIYDKLKPKIFFWLGFGDALMCIFWYKYVVTYNYWHFLPRVHLSIDVSVQSEFDNKMDVILHPQKIASTGLRQLNARQM